MRPGRPADEAAVARVLNAGEIQGAFVGGELGDVGHPLLVGAGGGEVALQQVGGGCDVGPAAAPLAPRVDADQPLAPHHSVRPACSRADSAADELAVHPWAPKVQRDSRWICSITTSSDRSASSRADGVHNQA